MGYVLFHGGVSGAKRGGRVERFNDDADCRVFLSTDAAGTGLNLQHAASVVVNMDQPWNPAVLEQRIETDSDTGQTNVKVPISDTETVQRLVSTLSDLLRRNARHENR